jgi:hypothetical protein
VLLVLAQVSEQVSEQVLVLALAQVSAVDHSALAQVSGSALAQE